MVLVCQLIFDSGIKIINPCRGWKGLRGGIVREFGVDMYTRLYLKWITNKDLLYSTWNSAQWNPRWEGAWGKMDTCICMTEPLCCPSETITLLTGYTPIPVMLKKLKLNGSIKTYKTF